MPTVNMSPKLCVLPPSVCRRAVISFDDNLADPPKFGLCFISVTSVLGAAKRPAAAAARHWHTRALGGGLDAWAEARLLM